MNLDTPLKKFKLSKLFYHLFKEMKVKEKHKYNLFYMHYLYSTVTFEYAYKSNIVLQLNLMQLMQIKKIFKQKIIKK